MNAFQKYIYITDRSGSNFPFTYHILYTILHVFEVKAPGLLYVFEIVLLF